MMGTTGGSAAEAAAAIGCTVAQIAKSLVFRAASGRAVLVIASGANRVDETKIAAAIGEKLGKADADFVRDRTGYAIGGAPPARPPPGRPTLIHSDPAHHRPLSAPPPPPPPPLPRTP